MLAVDSRWPTVMQDTPVYVTSEPPENEWGQPSASQYVFERVGNRLFGSLIAGVYAANRLRLMPSAAPCLAAELEAWDAASDEALTQFEAGLD